ncbi:tetratricopeptide repeat protein [Gilvimarinus algae]|uniref:Tetratricopeptide repeat protein n=1 Tax=Gilvimarinus algae TaxID=3058037 RepID=A0ABT8T995_9GAMM|nr:tetratricopeptide repeat protein [Gilvimarinus sp. SDUM040014]MDO3380689.1 tetratricopeptide repeat protein [Gilvimarinus sp. SDUM040014]
MRYGLILLAALWLTACASQKHSAEEVFATQEQAEQLYQQGDYSRALAAYREVTEALPSHTHSWLRLGNCHARLGNYPAAVAAYERALTEDPDFASAWINLTYVQAQILAQTVAQMYDRVPKTDPRAQRVQKLVDSVLTPFHNAQADSAPGDGTSPGELGGAQEREDASPED